MGALSNHIRLAIGGRSDGKNGNIDIKNTTNLFLSNYSKQELRFENLLKLKQI